MKIQIIGYSGSGKSTLAKQLGKIYNIPVLHLDKTKYFGNWEEIDPEEQTKTVQKFLDENESWVIDGNYSSICPQRFKISDITIYLNFNRFKCFWSAYKRYKQNKHKVRDSAPCLDKFDWSFAMWLLIKGRSRKRAKQIMLNLNKTSGEKYIFKNRRQVEAFVEKLKKKH